MDLIDSNFNDLALLPFPFYWKLITLIVALVAVYSFENGIKDRIEQFNQCNDLGRKIEKNTVNFETETVKLNFQISEKDNTIEKLNKDVKKCSRNMAIINKKLNESNDIINTLKTQGITEKEITDIYYSLKYEREVGRLNVLHYHEGKIITNVNPNFLGNSRTNFLFHLYYKDESLPFHLYTDITIGDCIFVTIIKNEKGVPLLQFRIKEKISSPENTDIFEKLNNNDKGILANTTIGLCYLSKFDLYKFETIERIFQDLNDLKEQMKRG